LLDTLDHRRGKQLRGEETFEDLALGDWFKTAGRTVTEADVVGFAALTWDRNPAHTDAVHAANSIFGERVAQGMLGLSYALGLVPSSTILALRRLKHVVFKAPILFGDTIHVEGYVTGLQPYSDEVGLLTGRWKVLKDDGSVAVKMEIDALIRRRNANDAMDD
jgi:acyl dehydratase